jgi:FKBP-type peptidyl-prolyl cis-trans isomerase
MCTSAESVHKRQMCGVQAKGGSFEGNDKDFLRIQYGTTKLIPGVQLALSGMKVGGIRRVIVPESLGYPNGDYKNWQPSPTTFAVRVRTTMHVHEVVPTI